VHHGEGTPAQPAQNLQGKLWLIFCTIQQKISCTIQQDKVLAHFLHNSAGKLWLIFCTIQQKISCTIQQEKLWLIFCTIQQNISCTIQQEKLLAPFLHNSAEKFLHYSVGKGV